MASVSPLFASSGLLLGLSFIFFLLLLAASAWIAAAEAALLGIPMSRRRELKEEGHVHAAAVDTCLDAPRRLVLASLFYRTLFNTTAAGLAAWMGLHFLGVPGLAAAVLIATVSVLVVAKVVPRAFARRDSDAFALGAAAPLAAMTRAASPVLGPLERISDAALRAGQPDTETNGGAGVGELRTLLALGAEEEPLEAAEEEMIHSVLEFSGTTAKEAMVPRLDMVAVPADATLDHVKAFVLESGFSRFPVYERSLDNVVGILYVKEVFHHLLEKRGHVQVREAMREPYFVPESMRLIDLLREMRERRMHVGIVVDEFGGTSGMITLEDVLEEIVGDIRDEHDLRGQEPIRKVDDLVAIVDARTHVADVNDALDLNIPDDEDYDTIAGYVHHVLGRLGHEGEIVQGEGFQLVLEKVTNRRILRVRAIREPPRIAGEDGAAEAEP